MNNDPTITNGRTPTLNVLKKFSDVVMDFLGAAFGPSITVLAPAGLLKGLMLLLAQTGFLAETSNTFLILISIADAAFYFLPVFLAINIANKFKVNAYVNALIALVLVFPSLVQLLEAEGRVDFLGFAVKSISYGSNLFPVILAVIASAYLEKALNKILPELIQGIITPLCCIALIVPLTLVVIGPLGDVIGNGLAGIFNHLYALSPIICGVILGFMNLPISLVGLNWALLPIVINNLSLTGRDPILATLAPGAWALVGVAFCMALRSTDKSVKSMAISAGFTGLFGIGEPAMFGIVIPLRKPLFLLVLINAVAGGFIGAFGSSAVAFSPPGPSAVALFVGPGFVPFIIICSLSMVAGFVGMMLLGYRDVPKIETDADDEELVADI